jgi:hypothetical protein
VAKRKIVSIIIAIMAGLISYYLLPIILLFPIFGVFVSYRLSDDDCTYHELVAAMNYDLLFIFPVVIIFVYFSFLIGISVAVCVPLVISIVSYYYFSYLSFLSTCICVSFLRCVYFFFIYIGLAVLGFMSCGAVDYATSLLSVPGWTGAKTHIISSTLVYILLVPISGQAGAMLLLFFTSIIRNIVKA